MAGFLSNLETGWKIVIGIVGFLAIILIITWLLPVVLNNLPDAIQSIGATATSTPINPPGFLETTMNVVLGTPEQTQWTWEQLILRLAIFLILMFALADIIKMFSTFSEPTSWVIGFCLAIVAGVTKFIDWIVVIMGVTAGIGAIGIFLIIAAAIFAAVTLNWGITPLFKWRMRRQSEIESMKAEKGTSRVTSAISGMKNIEKSLSSGE
jgi:hypothetical protein